MDNSSLTNRRPLQIVRLLYFFQFAGVGIFFTFINIFLHDAGLSGTQIGVINMLSALSGMLGATLWGYLSDRTGQTRLILMTGALCTAVVAQLYPLAHSFPGFVIFSSLFGFFNAAVSTLVDSLTLALLGSHREDYGRYRIGGSLGYILATFLSGLIFERTGLSILFPVYGLSGLALAIAAFALPSRSIQRETQHTGSIAAMIRMPAWQTVVICVFLIWLAMSGSGNFLNIAIRNVGGTDSLVGLVFMFSAVVEMPFQIYFGALVRRFGARRLSWIATFGFIVRFFLYSRMGPPGWAMAGSAFAGPSFVLFWNSTINQANRMAPPELAATAQGLIVSTTSLGSVVGALLSGWLYDQLGASGMFLVLAGSCGLAFLISTFSRGQTIKKSQIAIPK